jgi:hypothetical protein
MTPSRVSRVASLSQSVRRTIVSRLQFVTPILEWSHGDASRLVHDSAITLMGLDRDEPELELRIGPAARLTATLRADGSAERVTLFVGPEPGQSSLQRVNRLLQGTGYSLKAYHRAGGAVQVNGDGRYQPLPGSVMLRDGQWGYAQSGVPLKMPEPVAVPASVTEDPSPVLKAVTTVVPDPTVVSDETETDLLQRPTVTSETEVKVKRDVVEGLDRLWKLHVDGKRQVLCLIGPTGTGKTSLIYDMAARNKVGIFNFDCAGAREFSDFVGVTHLRGQQTVFVPSGLLRVLDLNGPYAGQPRVVNLDEITRAESAQALNALISMLHDFARIYVPEAGVAFDLDPAVMFTMTANRGAQYTGTVGLDLALANRVTAWVKMSYADATIEAKVLQDRTGIGGDEAVRLVGAAQRIRDMDERGELPEGGGVSTRLLLKAAEKVAAGFDLHAAASWTWVGNYSDEGGTQSEAYQVQSAIDMTLR